MTVSEPEGPPPGARRRLLAASLALALAACGAEPAAPSWHALARGFEPRPLAALVAHWERADPPRPEGPGANEIEPNGPGMDLRHRYTASEWRPGTTPGSFTLELPGGAFRASGARARLLGRGAEHARAPGGRAPAPGEIHGERKRLTLVLAPDARLPAPSVLVLERAGTAPLEQAIAPASWFAAPDAPGTFWIEAPRGVTLERARLFAALVRVDAPRPLVANEYRFEDQELVLCSPAGPPPAVELVAHLESGRVVDGQWQLRLGRFCATGVPVWSGAREELALCLPPASQLAFRFVHSAAPGAAPVRARIRLDDQTLFEETYTAGAWSEPRAARVVLPPAGRAEARLVFEVEGPPGLGAFFTPTIAPAAHGAPGARPWPTRPDLVVLLVDTLRADSLALSGGDPGLAPALNRFAETCLAFPHARSNAAWTLPSISSILTGLHPGQHGATDEDLTLASVHQTIAEGLARAGYRTGAITDGSFFSPTFGLDQGFEWFAHHEPADWDLDRTLAEAREFLALDDGRPVFLVLHTYRVHQPYRVGPEEDSSAYDALMARARTEAGTDSPAAIGQLARHARELSALYHEGVRDLDRALGAFLEELEERRWFEHGALVLTSDHGESLGENQAFFHGGHLWETKLRVPLLLRAPGCAPRVNPCLASPVDLAPTLAELARLPLDPRWVGSSLLGLERERPAFAFQLTPKSRQVACLEQDRKVILTPEERRLADGDCEEAFDLVRDPREEENQAGRADWPAELTLRLAPAIRTYLRSHASAEPAAVTPEMRASLDALGYGGEDD